LVETRVAFFRPDLVERMRIPFLFSGIFLAAAGPASSVAAQTFTRRYDALDQQREQFGFSIERSGTDRYVVLGTTALVATDGEYYNPAVVTMLLDINGNVLAEDTLIYPLHESYSGGWNCMSPLSDGGFVSAGWTRSFIGPGSRAAIYALTDLGAVSLVAEYGTEGDPWYGYQTIGCKDGGFLLIGGKEVNGETDAVVTKTDTSGGVLWQQTYGGAGQVDFLLAGDTAQDDGFFVGGQAQVSPSDLQFWVQRLDASGDTIWSRTWGGPFAEWYAQLSTKANANPVIASAWGESDDYDPTRCYMAELDADDGEFVWQRWYGSPSLGTRLYSVKETSAGQGHIAAGGTVEGNTPDLFFKGLLLRTADNGDSLWMRSYFYYDSLMNDGMGNFFDAVPAGDGGFIACGHTQHTYAGPDPYDSRDIWVMKVDSLGCIIPGCDDFNVTITEQVTNLKEALTVAPNPAQGSTTVKVTLPAGSLFSKDLRLRLVSAQGQEVLVQKAAVGENALLLQGHAAGIYYVHLTSGSTWLSGARLVVE